MWNLAFTPPTVIEARVFTRLPDAVRQPRRTDWVDANKPGHVMDSFLEGPAFDRDGNLYVTDIPYGRIFRIGAGGDWSLVAEYDGWPNGLAIHADGTLWIADYRRGILRLDPATGRIDTVLGHRNSESFKGVNDLTFDRQGRLYFTDQGQTGLHDPTGRVYRYGTDGRLDQLLGHAPSPNGLALSADGAVLFVAVTRGNQVWRAPLLPDGSVSKVGAFQTFFGTSGPDGMALDAEGRLVVAHASLGGAFVLNARGEVTHFVRSSLGHTITNVAYRPGTNELVLTDSQTGTVLVADMPAAGALLPSHA
ncbi:SMP-30/gluconolactonase/LRE family protein [Paenacidovorax monticola]|uniref:SMP-30/gluconolactonase/LRE family protein n=1 Tax=Paenacidovorax monticola TaxID=1926868 RepID=A0A7H0HBZ8_9BURK|nr:SMP-30/gluconolactonase/LRE family protein [Paenacidovorax monticola]QNP58064.1 SMP-30/gluconolactonase/LRE family protein [Paenacidovorax monticola]